MLANATSEAQRLYYLSDIMDIGLLINQTQHY